MQYIERSIESRDWITLLLVGSFVLIAILSVSYKKKFEDFIRLPFSNNYFISKGSSNEIRHPFNISFFCIQIVSISLFIYLFISKEITLNSTLFIQIIIGVSVFTIVKLFIEKMIGTIFSIENFINQYVYKKLTYRNFLALFLLAVNLFLYLAFDPSPTTLLVITSVLMLFNSLVVFYSIKNYRSLLFSNFFYFILYLCTLEISPYYILYKALI